MRILILSLVFITSLATACGSSDNPPTGLCAENGVTTDIMDNHPSGSHRLVVTVADVLAGVEKTYDIQGNNTGHGHTVTVTPTDFTALNAGTVVTIISSDTGAVGNDHTHPIVLTCEPQT